VTHAQRDAAQALCTAGRALFDEGLTPGSSGNLSMRIGEGFLMSPTNVALRALVPAQLALLDADGGHVGGGVATKEAPLHLAVYRARPQAQAIVHVHSPYAVALACLADVDPDNVLEPLTPYARMRAGRVVLAPYARPGSAELAAAVAARAGETGSMLLANHGSLVAAASLDAALAAAVEIEAAARVQLLVHNRAVRRLSDAELAALDA
jgi:ribulose-5-phosphate 4-epimerase/fuculose-1-phosphate aldolase